MFDFNKKICRKYILSPACKEIYLPLSSGRLQALKDEGITCGGVSFLRDYYKITRPDPKCNHLIFTVAGRGRLLLPDAEFALEPGSVFTCRKGMPHCYMLDGDYWEIAWLNVACGANALEDTLEASPPVRTASMGQRIKALIEAASEEDARGDMHSPDALKAIGQLLTIALRREFSIGKMDANSEKAQFQELEAKIAKEINREWDLKSLILESKMFYTPVHFNRLCKKRWGMPPMKKVASLRMQEAKNLLLNTDYPVKTIATMAGYSNAYAFSSAFKKSWGVSPRNMRASL